MTKANQNKENITKSQWQLKVKSRHITSSAGNAIDQEAISSSFALDWLKGWHEFYSPIMRCSKEKSMQLWILFYTS